MEPEGRASALPLSRAEHAIGFFRSIMTGRWQDYVYNLAAAVRALAPEAYDSHLFALEVRLSHIASGKPICRLCGLLGFR